MLNNISLRNNFNVREHPELGVKRNYNLKKIIFDVVQFPDKILGLKCRDVSIYPSA